MWRIVCYRLVFGLFDSAEVVCVSSVSFAPFSCGFICFLTLSVLSEAATKARLKEK